MKVIELEPPLMAFELSPSSDTMLKKEERDRKRKRERKRERVKFF